MKVGFSQAVIVDSSGSPELLLETGMTDRVATFYTGNGTSVLTFRSTIQVSLGETAFSNPAKQALIRRVRHESGKEDPEIVRLRASPIFQVFAQRYNPYCCRCTAPVDFVELLSNFSSQRAPRNISVLPTSLASLHTQKVLRLMVCRPIGFSLAHSIMFM